MNNLTQYIIEKLHLNKNTDTKDLLDKALDEEYIKNIPSITKTTMNRRGIMTEPSDWPKMQGYYKKGSKPERLVNSIKDDHKLLRRFATAIDMKWDDAVNVFGHAIIDRNIWNKDEVILYISKRYK